ncbi:hypothetical protein ACI3PF_21075, partial [Lactococcus lactis]
RSSVTFTSTSAGNPAPGADNIGVNVAGCPTCEFSARAVGNVDNDPGGDEMWVSSAFMSVAGGACAEQIAGEPPGSPAVTHNDVN